MADPFAPISPGKPSPFAFRADTVNDALAILRAERDKGTGRTGAGNLALDVLPPALRVWIRNDAYDDVEAEFLALEAYYVVKLGNPLFDLTSEHELHAMRREPVFPGTVPDAASNSFGIVTEPAAAKESEVYSYVRAVVQGVVPVDINMTTTFPTHAFASPTAGDRTKMTSGTSGPAKILYAPTGTGTKRAIVLIDGQGDQPLQQSPIVTGVCPVIASWRTITATTDTMTQDDDAILLDTTSNNIAVTLPAWRASDEYFFKRISSGGNTVTVTAPSAGTIDGAAGAIAITPTQWNWKWVKASGTSNVWYFVG